MVAVLIGTTPQLAQKLVFCNSGLDKSAVSQASELAHRRGGPYCAPARTLNLTITLSPLHATWKAKTNL
jgi:hypothetical protein